MRKLILSIPLVFMLSSCSKSSAIENNQASQGQTNEEIEQSALKIIFNKLNKTTKTAVIKDNKIFIGNNHIYLKIKPEFQSQKEGKWVYAANFQTFYTNGKEAEIDIGSIGIGSTKEEAITTCVDEWVAIFGLPFIDMVSNKNPLRIDKISVFTGPMGIRGNLPKNTWLQGDDKMTKKIISHITSEIVAQPNEIVPIDIKLMIGKNGITGGECRIGNQVSPELLSSLKTLNWPLADEEFIFKQFYLVKM